MLIFSGHQPPQYCICNICKNHQINAEYFLLCEVQLLLPSTNVAIENWLGRLTLSKTAVCPTSRYLLSRIWNRNVRCNSKYWKQMGPTFPSKVQPMRSPFDNATVWLIEYLNNKIWKIFNQHRSSNWGWKFQKCSKFWMSLGLRMLFEISYSPKKMKELINGFSFDHLLNSVFSSLYLQMRKNWEIN